MMKFSSAENQYGTKQQRCDDPGDFCLYTFNLTLVQAIAQDCFQFRGQ